MPNQGSEDSVLVSSSGPSSDAMFDLRFNNKERIRTGKKIENYLPSGPVDFSFHLPPLRYYLPMQWLVYQSEDKCKQSMLGFLTNPCFQLN